MSEYRVHNISFEGDVVTMSYSSSTDLRVKGMVGIMHQIQMSLDHPDYLEDGALLERQAVRMLHNAIEDFNESEPWSPADRADDDRDEEMGSRHRD